jgi:hypothetical protein
MTTAIASWQLRRWRGRRNSDGDLGRGAGIFENSRNLKRSMGVVNTARKMEPAGLMGVEDDR